MNADESKNYEDMTVAELKDLLRERDLPVSGVKATLIERLETDGPGDVTASIPMPKGYKPVVAAESLAATEGTPPTPDLVIESAESLETEPVTESVNIEENGRSEFDSLVEELRNTVAQLKTLLEVTAHTVEVQVATLASAVKKATEDAANTAKQSEAAKASADAASKAQKMAGSAAATATDGAKGAAKKVKTASKKLKKK
ncbi:MAG: SAP domain-containing protein [Anaerolineae bacterium]|nr:SAP domain-containing protein [Anaerolineae bacterium]